MLVLIGVKVGSLGEVILEERDVDVHQEDGWQTGQEEHISPQTNT